MDISTDKTMIWNFREGQEALGFLKFQGSLRKLHPKTRPKLNLTGQLGLFI